MKINNSNNNRNKNRGEKMNNNNSNNNHHKNEYKYHHLTDNKGFSLFEVIIAIILGISVMAVLMTLTLGGVKNNRFALTLADMSTLTEQKASDIFKDIPKQIKNMPNGVNTLGSINPTQPVNGYFDLLNDSGCVLTTGYQLESGSGKGDLGLGGGKGGLGGGTGTGDDGSGIGGGKGGLGGGLTGGGKGGNDDGSGKGDDGNGGSGNGTITGLDCSRATFGVPTSSLVARYRRQWVIVKNKPDVGDTTVAIVLVDLISNSILRSQLITKIDGKYSISN